MPGIAKRKYIGEIMHFNKGLSSPLKFIFEVLPHNYNEDTIIDLFKELYPYEWKIINQRYNNYKEKDLFLIKHGKKERYKPENPREYLLNLPQVQYKLKNRNKSANKIKFNEEDQLKKLLELRYKRLNVINKKKEKLGGRRELIQSIEPLYMDIFISAYHKKGIRIEEKIEIFKELQKYDCDKSREFFLKLNDSERNKQIRKMAFNHLQEIGHYVKLRKDFKGKKKVYMSEKRNFQMTPLELFSRIEADSIQNKKKFDIFISHSVKNSDFVKILIKILNEENLISYCDWTSDSDFLKREYVNQYTKGVLKKRLEQSKRLLFIRTEDSSKSEWVKFELEYFLNMNKKIYYIDMISNDKKIEKDLIDKEIILRLIKIYIDLNEKKLYSKYNDNNSWIKW